MTVSVIAYSHPTADEAARPCQDCPFRKDCETCRWQGGDPREET